MAERCSSRRGGRRYRDTGEASRVHRGCSRTSMRHRLYGARSRPPRDTVYHDPATSDHTAIGSDSDGHKGPAGDHPFRARQRVSCRVAQDAMPGTGVSLIKQAGKARKTRLARRMRVDLVHLVYVVCLVQPSKRDRPDKQKKPAGPRASPLSSATAANLFATVAKCGYGGIKVEAFVSRMETEPSPHICFFHAGKPMLDPCWINKKFSTWLHQSHPACQLLFTGLYNTHHNPPASTCVVSCLLKKPLCRQLVRRLPLR